uniref:fibrinogen-like protein A n=1 Tax=Styela clava TaxID=7725 RepID=UPI001939F98C|nr:fibrinogen-like protein A [Styela clava]
MSAAPTEFCGNFPQMGTTPNTIENFYEDVEPQPVKSKDTEHTTVRRGLIVLAIFLSMVVGLVVSCLVIITQLQSEMRIMKHQEDKSIARLKWLEENASEVIYSKLNEQQIRINQSIEDISTLDHSHQQLKKSIIQELFPKDCKSVNGKYAKIQNTTGGVFDIYPELRAKPVEVYCDIVTDGGGWIVFQRRMDGTEDFYRGWNEYVNGFGEKYKEMWLGLETIHQLTKKGSYELRIDLENYSGTTAYAKYGTFSISSASENYTLLVGEYNGTAGDSLTYHNNMQFSTKDSDNDDNHNTFLSGHCAVDFKGAWWYKSCHQSNLNGFYYEAFLNDARSVHWSSFKGYKTLKFTEMKFRQKT